MLSLDDANFKLVRLKMLRCVTMFVLDTHTILYSHFGFKTSKTS